MSGKAPPTGPRALRVNDTGSSGQASSSSPVLGSLHTSPPKPQVHPQPPKVAPSSLPVQPGSRIGAVPPTGPRSLLLNNQSRQPPGGPKHHPNGHSNFSNSGGSNGLLPHGLQSNRNPVSIKGKKRDLGPIAVGNHSWQPPHSQLNGRQETSPNGNSNALAGSNGNSQTASSSRSASPTVSARPGELKQDRPAVHISMQSRNHVRDRLPSSATEPLPPPPIYDPPPPPPPSQPPPPSPPPPTEPDVQPPPPPPSESFPTEPPPPPPPASPPPQSPPPLPPASPPPPLPSSTDSPTISLPPPPPSEFRDPSPPPPPPSPPPQINVFSEPPPPHRSPPPSISLPPPRPPPVDAFRVPSPLPPPPSLPSFPGPASLPLSLPRRPPSAWDPPSHLREPRHRSYESEQTKKLYSLPPLPSWPPPRSEYPPDRSFRILYDSYLESSSSSSSSPVKHLPQQYPPQRGYSHYRSLIEYLKNHHSPDVQERLKSIKGKDILMRYEGETLLDDEVKEDAVVVMDPRKSLTIKRPHVLRPPPQHYGVLEYEYDNDSCGPPPPTAILIVNVNPLTPNNNLRRHLAQYGNITSFESQIDQENGQALGIYFVKYQTHDEAKRCLEKEHGRRGGLPGGLIGAQRNASEPEEWRVVFDGEGQKLKSVMKELEERKKREKEGKWNQQFYPRAMLSNGATPIGSGNANTPLSGVSSPAPGRPQPLLVQRGGQRSDARPASLPEKPMVNAQPPVSRPPPADPRSFNHTQSNTDKLTDALRQAREQAERTHKAPLTGASLKSTAAATSSASTTSRGKNVLQTSKYAPVGAYQASPMNISRSPSPEPSGSAIKSGGLPLIPKSAADREKARREVMRELAKNGHDHVKVQGGVQLVASVREESVREFFEGFAVEKVLRDHTGIYVTFANSGVAHRASTVLGSKQLGFQYVTLAVHPAPSYEEEKEKAEWTEKELIEEASKIILQELKVLLEKDISEQLVPSDLMRVMQEEKSKGASALSQDKMLEKKGLKGLSFKKKKVAEVVTEVEVENEQEKNDQGDVGVDEDEDMEVVERPRKKRKTEVVVKKPRRVVDDEDIESEDDNEVDVARLAAFDARNKRLVSEDRDEEDEPVKKKVKVVEVKGKKGTKKTKKELQASKVHQATQADLETFDSPVVTQLRLSSSLESSLSPSRSPSPTRDSKRRKRVITPPPTPPPDPINLGICDDDEDLYFAKLALCGEDPVEEKLEPPPSSTDIPTFRKHLTGSARTEGYYKITHAEKAAYVAQYQARAANTGAAPPVVDEQPQHVTSSRSNRANARRRAQGLEEINQVQRAVALSKGETAASELTFKFNQLQTRKKHLRFARSPIHDWGLYAMEKISRGEMVIEYVGEVIRAQVADKREKAYERQGIGSSYLFRIDEDLVVDATKKGNLGRLINHSCDPNCTAKIITISGEKKIVIYAKQDIELGDEITYDYHFPFEQDKIPCLCGSAKCRGFLN